jgi:uncharacterized membrane protein YccC
VTSRPKWLKLPDDPGLAGLRPAARAALIMPPLFAIALHVIRDVQMTPFVAFGCFGFMVLADFGGERRPRAVAYIISALAGAVLITIGTLASSSIWLAVAGMFVVGVCVQFLSVFGGYTASAVTVLLLSFVLSVSIPGTAGAVPDRLEGWLLASLASTIASLVLWPRFERVQLRAKAAVALDRLASLVRARRRVAGDVEEDRVRASEAVEAARAAYRKTRHRPAGPMRRDRALAELLSEIERTLRFLRDPFHTRLPSAHPCIREGDRLAVVVARTLEASAGGLRREMVPDLQALDRERAAHRSALDEWALAELRAGAASDEILSGLAVDDALRVVAYLTSSIARNAVVAAGWDVELGAEVMEDTPSPGLAAVAARVLRTVQTHVDPRSSVLHGCLRTGTGLALAVLTARLLHLNHGFWVVLGTLSVLRSNALSTVEALAGTVVGFVVAAAFTAAVGATSPALWIVLPPAIFLAAYGSNAIGFVAGQAGFTVVVIIIFNLIAPVGWQLGVARVQDVAIGAVISVIVAALLWPHGARRELSLGLARLYRAAGAFVEQAFRRFLEGDVSDMPAAERARAAQALEAVSEPFDRFMNERGSKHLPVDAVGDLVAFGSDAILAGDALLSVARRGYALEGCPDSEATLRSQLTTVLDEFSSLAARLEGTGANGRSGQVSDKALRQAALACLARWRDNGTGSAAIATVIAGEWIDQLGEMAAGIDELVTQAGEVARLPWWR